MKTAEEIAVENYLFKNIDSIYGIFDLQLTRDGYKHTSELIIKAINQAQIEAWNSAIENLIGNIKLTTKIMVYDDVRAGGTYEIPIVDYSNLLTYMKTE